MFGVLLVMISVRFCVSFSFILCVVYFVIKFIKYNDLFFPVVRSKVNPASHREGDTTDGMKMMCLGRDGWDDSKHGGWLDGDEDEKSFRAAV